MSGLDAVGRHLLAEAADLRLIGLLFERPQPGWAEHVKSLARESKDPHLQVLMEAELLDEGSSLALIGPGAPCNPREAAHVGLPMPGPLLAEIRAYYTAFGYAPRAEEPPDHLSVECGFLAFLKLKEAAARQAGAAGAAREAAAACARFAQEHVARLATPVAEALGRADLPGARALLIAATSLQHRVGRGHPAPAPVPEEACLTCPAAG